MSEKFELKLISTVLKSNWTRYEKYRVELAFPHESKSVYWMTEKQFNKLQECFGLTPKGWSGKKAAVYGVFAEKDDGKLRFVWCGIERSHHSDLPWLEERFGVIKQHGYVVEDHEPPVLETPENVTVPDELQEND